MLSGVKKSLRPYFPFNFGYTISIQYWATYLSKCFFSIWPEVIWTCCWNFPIHSGNSLKVKFFRKLFCFSFHNRLETDILFWCCRRFLFFLSFLNIFIFFIAHRIFTLCFPYCQHDRVTTQSVQNQYHLFFLQVLLLLHLIMKCFHQYTVIFSYLWCLQFKSFWTTKNMIT